jgi:hypothetical protein
VGLMNRTISNSGFSGRGVILRSLAFSKAFATQIIAGLMISYSICSLCLALGAEQKHNITPLWSYRNARPIVDWTPEEIIKKMPELKDFEPAQSQDPLPDILRKVGENVQAFFHNFVSTASVEEIHQESTGFNGRANLASMKLNYLLLAVPGPNGISLREYRTDSRGKSAVIRSESGHFLLTTGFAAVSVYFTPQYQATSRFRYLGKKSVDDHPMLLVAFAQEPDPKVALGSFESDVGSIPVLVQGVAWIDPASDQIERLRTDLLAPQPDVTLQRLTTDITFREVRFRDSSVVMWLPHEVNVLVTYHYTIYQNQHRYSDYKLFNVDAGTKASDSPSPRSPE